MALRHEGIKCIFNSRFDQAIGFFSRAIQCNPSAARLRIDRGVALRKSSQFVAALDDFTAVTSTQENKEGFVDIDAGDTEKTVINSKIENGIEDRPRSVLTGWDEAAIGPQGEHDQNKSDGSVKSSSTGHLPLSFSGHKLHRKASTTTDAIIIHEMKIRASPQEVQEAAYQRDLTYNDFGLFLLRHGQAAEALPYFSLAIQFQPSNSTFFLNRSDCKRELLDFDGALKDLRCAHSLSPATNIFQSAMFSLLNEMGLKAASEGRWVDSVSHFDEVRFLLQASEANF
uniref:Uncharacterized protein n=2 Tax=Palpitomonas bilix TaxID=652834 RepID=A0A7S3D2Y4_9EUKA|mmetsp:Transcript_17991/g.44612  ORF Transcript_17991/g.44612 Transcript_17991/m.44612 type:complete len:285 (+) Transcript_17991:393-1247(+)